LIGVDRKWLADSQNDANDPQRSSRWSLLDYLVGGGQQRFGDGEAEGFGGLEIEHQFVFERLLHRQVRWLLAPEDTIDIGCGPTNLVTHIGTVGNKAALRSVRTISIDRRHPVSVSRLDDEFAIVDSERVRLHD